MSVTYPDPIKPHDARILTPPAEALHEEPFVPVYARRGKARGGQGKIKTWMILTPVAALVLGGIGAMLIMGGSEEAAATAPVLPVAPTEAAVAPLTSASSPAPVVAAPAEVRDAPPLRRAAPAPARREATRAPTPAPAATARVAAPAPATPTGPQPYAPAPAAASSLNTAPAPRPVTAAPATPAPAAPPPTIVVAPAG